MSFLGDYHKELKCQSARGRCLHFADGERCNEIISAHSIQKKGQLGLIAENGHVYKIIADLSTLKKSGGYLLPKKIGVNKVSTFLGFCKHHDNALFKIIDNLPLEPLAKQIVLYAYRCICREYFVKENAIAVLDKMMGHPELGNTKKLFLNSTRIGHSLGLEGLKHHKSFYEKALLASEYEEFEFTYFTSSSRCSLQLSGLLYPNYDFIGNKLQDLGNWHSPLDLITFFTAPTREGWAFGFGWHASSNKTCVPFLQSLASYISSGGKPEDALLRFSLSCCENHAIRISWWDTLPEYSKKEAIERIQLMIHPNIPVPKDYLASGCEDIADWQFEHVYTTLQAVA
ncbi:MAG: hypothetical protein HC889_04875 [Synechococcaceae cyanobacterium SM1_2_3]|nr:hypothetical protein [Synechococcaceae cyanobacterium SM1_2_3]